jgi:hypothetical protein
MCRRVAPQIGTDNFPVGDKSGVEVEDLSFLVEDSYVVRKGVWGEGVAALADASYWWQHTLCHW